MTYLCRKERCSALLAKNLRWPSAHLKVENQIAPRSLNTWPIFLMPFCAPGCSGPIGFAANDAVSWSVRCRCSGT
jgi:hypothetical protein